MTLSCKNQEKAVEEKVREVLEESDFNSGLEKAIENGATADKLLAYNETWPEGKRIFTSNRNGLSKS